MTSWIMNNKLERLDEFQPRNVREDYHQIQRDPYKYLLSPNERAAAWALIPRIILGYGLGFAWAAYHLRRNNEIHKLWKLRLSGDLVFGFYFRLLGGFILGERIAARYFCDYKSIWRHKAADYEVRKLMRAWPNAKPFVQLHEKPNSYFWW